MATAGGLSDRGPGLVGGAVAWTVGLGITALLIAVGLVESGSSRIAFVLAVHAEWHLSGLLLGATPFTAYAWAIVPIAVLGLTGFAVARQGGGDWILGAEIAAGYFVMTFLSGVYLAGAAGYGIGVVEVTVHLLVGGICFPAIFGGLGGVVASGGDR